MNTTTIAGITYFHPTATILHSTPLLVAEYAGRTAYNSFKHSEHPVIRHFDNYRPILNPSHFDANSSQLLTDLAWTYHHHSVLEHINISYLIEGTSRGVLQELARHRIASYTVQSTRYTMSDILYAFIASLRNSNSAEWFINHIILLGVFTINGIARDLEIAQLYAKLFHQYIILGESQFYSLALSKANIAICESNPSYDASELYPLLSQGKAKRNVGDSFKWVVTDNWSVSLVMTMNLRSLRNFFQLRDSGAAYFLIQLLATSMKSVTPSKYLNLIIKEK